MYNTIADIIKSDITISNNNDGCSVIITNLVRSHTHVPIHAYAITLSVHHEVPLFGCSTYRLSYLGSD